MDNATEIYRRLEADFQSMALHRPMRIERYEAGTELKYAVTSVDTASKASVRLAIDKFIGGGFAGAFVGGFSASRIGFGTVSGFDQRSLLIAVCVAIFLLVVFRIFKN